MAVFPIGKQRLGFVTDTATGVYDELGQPVLKEEAVFWVDGCVLEVQTMNEFQNVTTTTTAEIAVAVLPVIGDRFALVDEHGKPAGFKPVAEATSAARLREFGATGRDYELRGDAVLHKDIRGRPDHIECRCERQNG